MKVKYYKPGQLVTINHKVYRVTRSKNPLGWCCKYCVAFLGIGICLNRFKEFCNLRRGKPLMPVDCYFKLVK